MRGFGFFFWVLALDAQSVHGPIVLYPRDIQPVMKFPLSRKVPCHRCPGVTSGIDEPLHPVKKGKGKKEKVPSYQSLHELTNTDELTNTGIFQ